jgi:hypothetical protein
VRSKLLLKTLLLFGIASPFALWEANYIGVQDPTKKVERKQPNDSPKNLPTNILALLKREWNSTDSQCPLNVETDSRASRVDLNGDGTAELFVFPSGPCLCSPTGNCYFVVYQISRNKLQIILEWDGVQSFTVLTNKTKGYLDISTYMHGSAYEGDLRIWKFDGKQYQIAECFDQTYSFIDDKGQQHILREPRKTRIPCW